MASETPSSPGTTTEEEGLLAQLNPLKLPLRHQLGLLGLLGLILLPTQLYPRQVQPMIGIVFLMMFAMSWDVVSGYTGQLSFGHAFFFALGGYGSAILNLQHGLHPVPSILIATVVAAIGGVLVGLPALRLRGPYLSLVTLIVPLILAQLFILWNNSLAIPLPLVEAEIPIAPDGFGGQSGLAVAPDPLIGPSERAVITVGGDDPYQVQVLGNYYLALGVFSVVLATLLAVTRSTAGSIFTAIREDEDAVQSAGLNPAKYKLFAFVLSAAVGGLASAVYVHSMAGYPQPSEILNIGLSINVIVMTILGGMGTIVGPIIGALAFGATTALINVLDEINVVLPILGQIQYDVVVPFIEKDLEELKPLPLLTIAILTLVYMPEGILPYNIKEGREVLRKLRGEETETEGGGDGDDGESHREGTPLGTAVEKYREEMDKITGGEDK